MSRVIPPHDAVESALRARLLIVASVLAPGVDPQLPTRDLLHELAVAVKRESTPPRAWLLFVAIAGAFPAPPDVGDLRRRLDLAAEGAALVAVLAATIDLSSRTRGALRRLELVRGGVIVDVNFCAKHEHNTGIQRVVRETLPRWVEAGRDIRLVAWTHDSSAFRSLDAAEEDRVLHWNDRTRPEVPKVTGDVLTDEIMIVPWGSHVFLPEVPLDQLCSQLAAIAESSGNDVRLIGYDAIPLVSADGQRSEESERFAHYLSIVKHSEAVLAISESAAEEFRGFTDALDAQGLVGPRVDAVPLAVEVPPAALGLPHPERERPLVLCVGSHEPRKNQEAVLAAGEQLSRDGLDFELVFVGGGNRSATSSFDSRAARLRRGGFAVRSLRGLADSELWALFASARFTVFISLHEGFGLPVAESLALGVPVLTSDFGSLAEIAAMGGCVTVDPRDDDRVADAMRTMLTDDELIARLRAEAAAIPSRTWRDYADELWLRAGLGEAVVAR
jgi:glycosyltransferase involved in cell wall biosynthesis